MLDTPSKGHNWHQVEGPGASAGRLLVGNAGEGLPDSNLVHEIPTARVGVGGWARVSAIFRARAGLRVCALGTVRRPNDAISSTVRRPDDAISTMSQIALMWEQY